MINDQNALQHLTIRLTTPTWRSRPGLLLLALRALRRAQKREDFEPDRFATETPFLTDAWPRG
jgi:hypothetical protein